VAWRLMIENYQELMMSETLNNPQYWEKKIRIAILALATFIAMC
jgi:hypothetical protein